MKRFVLLILSLAIIVSLQFTVHAQEQSAATQPTAEDLEKQKAEWKKSAYRLLDQVIDEAQALRLPENRVRIQINAADLLWEQNEARARSLFQQAADSVAEMTRTLDANSRQNQQRRPMQLRQELVLAVARHDAQLAYQLLAVTKPATPSPTPNPDPRNPRAQLNSEENLEQNLLARVAALDPKLAAQNADQMLEKGQFPRSLAEVINQLQKQDAEAATKLADKTIRRLQSTNLLSNSEASTLAMALLAPGPRIQPASTVNSEQPSNNQAKQQQSVLELSAYGDLLSSVIDSALKATPQTQTNQRQNQRGRGQGGGQGVGPGGNTQPTDAQIEQANARRLLAGLRSILPQIDANLPSRASAVRQKLTEVGMSDNSRTNMAQAFTQLQQGNASSDSLMQMASTMPPQVQSRIYQQAAFRALDEGNADRARQIANDHLQANTRDAVLQRIDFRELAKKAEGTRIDEIRQSLARLSNESDRIDQLLQMANDLAKSNPKLARQLLEEAKQMTSRRATNYDQFEQQLKVAHAFASVDPARSFEVLDPGISQLNELLAAAALLSGFEVNIFRDGELPIQGGAGLTATVNRYGQELALLARNDLDRSETLASRFQFPEPRIMARLSIVQGLLGVETAPTPANSFVRFGSGMFMRDQ